MNGAMDVDMEEIQELDITANLDVPKASGEVIEYIQTLNVVPKQIGNVNDSLSLKMSNKPGGNKNSSELSNKNVDYDKMASLLGLPPKAMKHKLMASLNAYPFTHLLYLAAGSDNCSFVCWTPSGNELEIRYIALQEYLASKLSIFDCLTVEQFFSQLHEYGFQRVCCEPKPPSEPTTMTDIYLYYRHENFLRDNWQQLLLIPIQYPIKTNSEIQTLEPSILGNALRSSNERLRKRGDVCASFQSFETPLQLARGRFETMLQHHVNSQLLHNGSQSEVLMAQLVPRRGRSASKTAATPEQSVHSAKYVTPQESVLVFEPGYCPPYAGYYGVVSPSQVNEFFADYLPYYGANKIGYKDVVTDARTKVNVCHQNLPIGIDFSDEDDEPLSRVKSAAQQELQSSQEDSNANIEQEPVDDNELEQEMRALCDADEDVQITNSTQKQESKELKPGADNDNSISSEDMFADADGTSSSSCSSQSEQAEPPSAEAAEQQDNEYEIDDDDDNDDDMDEDDDDDEDVAFHTTAKSAKRRCYDLRRSKRY